VVRSDIELHASAVLLKEKRTLGNWLIGTQCHCIIEPRFQRHLAYNPVGILTERGISDHSGECKLRNCGIPKYTVTVVFIHLKIMRLEVSSGKHSSHILPSRLYLSRHYKAFRAPVELYITELFSALQISCSCSLCHVRFAIKLVI
jgi:hypothetical protein